MNHVTLRQLRIFAAVAEAGAIAPAARRLRLSQATVSEALRDLEAVLGSLLFDRGGRPLQLTPAGRALAPDAREILQRSEALYRRHARQLRLTCGASVTVGNHILPPTVIAFHRRHPDVALDVIIRNSEQIARLVVEREVQVAVVEGRVAHSDLVVRPWRMDELAIVAPPGHPAASDPHEAELRSARWVLREAGAGTRESFDAWTASWPTPPQVVLTAGGNALIVAAVSAGIGLSCLSAAAVAGELQRGELVRVPVSAPELMRTLSLVQRRDGHADRALDAFLAVLDDPEADPQSSVV